MRAPGHDSFEVGAGLVRSLLDRGDEVVAEEVLEDDGVGSGAASNSGVDVGCGVDDASCCCAELRDPSAEVEAAAVGELHVEYGDVWLKFGQLFCGGGDTARVADHDDARSGSEPFSDPLADQRMIIDDHHGDRSTRIWSAHATGLHIHSGHCWLATMFRREALVHNRDVPLRVFWRRLAGWPC